VTPLEQFIRELIANEGPLRLDRFMALCLGHPQHGYYMSRDPFGARGDFITAPEVSQVFGELIGVWCATAWKMMGEPVRFHLIELGPGRGTLMADILRAGRVMPGFREAADVALIEMSPTLRAIQKETLGSATWHGTLDDVPPGPSIIVANEFFDAIPIRQFERRNGRWLERVVFAGEQGLQLGLAEAPELQGQESHGVAGNVIEWAAFRNEIAAGMGQRLAVNPGAALVIDYGHFQTSHGDTLQAMRQHKFVPITDHPGESDLTSHVDFEALAKAIASGGGKVAGMATQGDFLRAMGLDQRFAQLAAKLDDETRAKLLRAKSRLADHDQMGNLFKVLAAQSPGLATPYPFGRT
jgi:SAM-dependent MidA family methyltransferase